MEGSMLTLSLANWMELPGLKLKDWMREKRRCVPTDYSLVWVFTVVEILSKVTLILHYEQIMFW